MKFTVTIQSPKVIDRVIVAKPQRQKSWLKWLAVYGKEHLIYTR